jgi:murein DD-endopeptidase MepM/ murein hydrolase activator NlpD
MRRLLLLAFVFAFVALAPAHADPGDYVPPVDGPVVDPFRPPTEPWGPGNRGIDYAPAPGTPVRAAAAGVVTFAGQVGGALHVVIGHADGIRTSYSFLATIAVAAGDTVEQGQVVGTAGSDLHFGARVGDRYLDPATLFGSTGPPEVHLVPDDLAPDDADDRAALATISAARAGEIVTFAGAPAAEPGAGRPPSDVADALSRLAAAWR